jgi:hypothetical protein
MRMSYFGDSYDSVKQSLLRWLRPFGEWSIHPMFTEGVSAANVSGFEQFIGGVGSFRRKFSRETQIGQPISPVHVRAAICSSTLIRE